MNCFRAGSNGNWRQINRDFGRGALELKSASKAEEVASRALRVLLERLAYGSAIDDSDQFSNFQSALEHFIPAALRETYPWWEHESLDAFRFAVSRKLGPDEAEFIGLCLLISDQTWTPIHLRLRLAANENRLEQFLLFLGESGTGNGGMVRMPYNSASDGKLVRSVEPRLQSIQWAYTLKR